MALVCALVVIVIAVAGYNLLPADTLPSRIFQLLGGQLPGGVIQFVTYFAFFWGIFEINERSHRITHEKKSFELGLLPEKEQWVLSPNDVNDLKLRMIDQEKNQRFLMTDIIKKACTKFRSNRSISDVIDVVSMQSKINMQRAEGSQSMVRYLAWAIPSIGFIGTILGIAGAMGYAGDAGTDEGIKLVTNALFVAFDTTLISLFLSIILMWFFHNLQEQEDVLHTDIEEYVIENLVNRIHVE